MLVISTEEPLALAVVDTIHTGDQAALRRLLSENPGLATARLGDSPDTEGGMSRSLLHVVTDWPGHFPNGAATVATLVSAGADVNARFTGPHTETPLHWAASSDDVKVLDALLDAGADIEAPGAVIADGTPLTDAVAFAQWNAAHRLVERGAKTLLGDAAALGILDLVTDFVAGDPPIQEEISHAFWLACHGGQRRTAEFLLSQGADLNWLPTWESLTPLDAAIRSNGTEVIDWLRSQGALKAEQMS
ncbi:ankyrin repeat domain-containing protein [Streptosporangium sp. NPDC049078]|uniref:ankyrin repeat domain-containing protein n=1 Tax=Streptosporangium sp. NPDC049078 TaxID=3155767 RepID=UPI0034271768